MSELSKWLKKQERSISKRIPHEHSRERRARNEAVAEQISFYKQQKEMMNREYERSESERKTERDKISKKQIRSMRRSYRAPGFMEDATVELSERMGG